MFITLLSQLIWANPEAFQVPMVTPDEYDELLEQAAGLSGRNATGVMLWTTDDSGRWIPTQDFLPPVELPPSKEASIGVDVEGDTEGFLSGKAIYLSQCHGWIYNENLGRFATQRGNNFSTVEDFHNPEGTNQYLIHYLENAGARVFTTKERGMNTNMSISDNDGSGYTESGSDFEDGPLGFADLGFWEYGEDPFNAGTTRKFPSNGGSKATWMPDVPESGFYTLYVSWDSDSQNSTQAHYRITHNGGSIDRYFDQTVHGSTWQYAEQLWMEEGTGNIVVELIADDAQSGKYLSADAVRIGGGMGDVVRGGDTTERPRWEGGAIQYTQFNGAPTSVYDPYGDGDGSDPASRSRWAAWEHPSGEDAVYLSWHSNASGGSARGTSTYIYSPDWGLNTGFVAGSDTFASYVQDELIDIFQSNWESDWQDRGVRSANFAEVNPNHNNEMPSILIELAFHDNETDTEFLKEPLFRRDASKAMYRGIVQYFANKDGVTPKYAPNVPDGLKTEHSDNEIVISWNSPSTNRGDAADKYLLFLSDDGLSWSEGMEVEQSSYRYTPPSYKTQYVRVSAVNEGGVSFPSNTLSFSRTPDGSPPVLIIDAFDRLQSSTLISEDVPTLGTLKRMQLRMINAYQSAVPHAAAISNMGWGFDSASDEALSSIDLEPYKVVIWIAGEESTADDSIGDAAQVALEDYWRAGGTLFVSGAELLWDLDYRGDAGDQDFALNVLGASMDSDDASTETAQGEDLLQGLSYDFSVDAGAMYHVEYPDVLSTQRATVIRYSSGGTAAAFGEGVFMMGFPFECISDQQTRDSTMKIILENLISGYSPPVATEPTAEPTSEPETQPSSEPEDSDLYTFDKESLDSAKGCSHTPHPPLLEWILLIIVGTGRRYGKQRIK